MKRTLVFEVNHNSGTECSMKDMSQKWLGKHQTQIVATLGTQDAALRQTKR
jgi:hypothetical protein